MSTLDKMRAKQGLTTIAATPPTSEDRTPKTPKQRKCCATMSGDSPHAPECVHMQPTKPKKPKPSFGKEIKGRLPHGAVYHKEYDADKQQWRATLTIPGFPVFKATASGSWKAEFLLDGKYRDHVLANKPKEA